MKKQIKDRVTTSPNNKDLSLSLFVAQEDLAKANPGVEIFEGVLTIKEYVEHFACEKNSDLIAESEKLQRDVSPNDARVKSMTAYIKQGASVFPGVTIFITDLKSTEKITVGTKEMVVATLPKDSDRHITDGQGRHTSASNVLGMSHDELVDLSLDDFGNNTISIKFVVTNTKTIYEARKVVRQTFSDYHICLRKPSSSISLFFDSATPYGRFMNELTAIEVAGKELKYWISLKGKLTDCQAWTLVQFANFVHTSLGKTKSTLNKELAEDSCYQSTLETFQNSLPMVLGALPLKAMEEDPVSVRANALFTKALFMTGYGYFLRSFIEDSMITGNINVEAFDKLESLPLTDMNHPELVDSKITTEKGKIIPHSAKTIGLYLCRKLRVIPSEVLTDPTAK